MSNKRKMLENGHLIKPSNKRKIELKNDVELDRAGGSSIERDTIEVMEKQ